MFIGVMAVFMFEWYDDECGGRAAQRWLMKFAVNSGPWPELWKELLNPTMHAVSRYQQRGSKEMMKPALMALAIPVVVGLVLGVPVSLVC